MLIFLANIRFVEYLCQHKFYQQQIIKSTIMKTVAMQPKGILPIQEAVDLKDVLRLIGMKELTNNVFSLPNKKKKAVEVSA